MTEKNARLELAERIAGHLGPVNFVTRSERDLIVAAWRASADATVGYPPVPLMDVESGRTNPIGQMKGLD